MAIYKEKTNDFQMIFASLQAISMHRSLRIASRLTSVMGSS